MKSLQESLNDHSNKVYVPINHYVSKDGVRMILVYDDEKKAFMSSVNIPHASITTNPLKLSMSILILDFVRTYFWHNYRAVYNPQS